MHASLSHHLVKAALALLAMSATSAFAQEEPEGPPDPLSIDFNLAGYSDYRFRGQTLSNEDFSIQPTITATLASGVYFSVFASNIAENTGDDIEIDLVAGISKDIGKVTAGLNATYYLFPGVSSLNYVELFGTLGTDVGPASVGLTLAYTPSQDSVGNLDNIYAAINGSLPVKGTPFTFLGSYGYEDGAFGTSKQDWSVGVTADVAGFTLGVTYIDSKRGGPTGDATAVLSIGTSF